MKSKSSSRGIVARVLALVLVVMILIAGVANNPNPLNPGVPTPTSTLDPNAPPLNPTVAFPSVPAGGTPVVADYTYFHPSARMSLPHLRTWDVTEGGEETLEPAGESQLARVGTTFISGDWLSVIHVFAEKDPTRTVKQVQDLDGYYTQEALNEAWINYTAGWSERGRKTVGEDFVIDFELRLETQVYLGRQVSRFINDWLVVQRLVVPNNNPQLLDQLQQALGGKIRMWTESETTPMTWGTFADYALGYVIRYPPTWTLTNGGVGSPITITGQLGASTITLTTRVIPGRAVNSEDDAKKFIQETWSNSTIKRVTQATSSGATGYAVSMILPDPDGNKLSAVATMLNGTNGNLYVAMLQSSAVDQDLLDPANPAIPLELTQVRNSFFVLPVDQLVPTPIPTITPTPLPTAIVNTPVPTVGPTTVPTTEATAAPTEAATESF